MEPLIQAISVYKTFCRKRGQNTHDEESAEPLNTLIEPIIDNLSAF